MEPGRYKITAELDVTGEDSAGNTMVKFDTGAVFTIYPGEFDFEPVLPEEPEHGAVVIDCDGDAWQNDEGEWSLAGAWLEDGEGRHYRQTWASVVGRYSPLKVIYTP
jgi:hypothetical protein